jgi:hypothetical protein
VRRDLFVDPDDGVFVQDLVLLESLVARKLEKAAAAIRKEGWQSSLVPPQVIATGFCGPSPAPG